MIEILKKKKKNPAEELVPLFPYFHPNVIKNFPSESSYIGNLCFLPLKYHRKTQQYLGGTPITSKPLPTSFCKSTRNCT